MKAITTLAACAPAMAATNPTLRADTFGSGANSFTIDFVAIGNAGNTDDTGAGGGLYSSPYGGVPYLYRIGMTEVPQNWIEKATNLGMTNVTAGAWVGMQPAAYMTWYEAAAFVNFLNTSTGHQAAYSLTQIPPDVSGNTWSMTLWASANAWQAGGENLYRHKDAYYFLPNEDEWYKAAFHKNDGVTGNYWDYATGSNNVPDGIDFAGDSTFQAVFFDGYNQGGPNVVTNAGTSASAYGTLGQGGNILEWTESATDGSNNTAAEGRAIRGGGWNDAEDGLRPTLRFDDDPDRGSFYYSFRVASVPEPSSAILLLFGAAATFATRRRRVH